jgi:hypothetical protein
VGEWMYRSIDILSRNIYETAVTHTATVRNFEVMSNKNYAKSVGSAYVIGYLKHENKNSIQFNNNNNNNNGKLW